MGDSRQEHKIQMKNSIWRTPSLHTFQKDDDKKQCLDVPEEGLSKKRSYPCQKNKVFPAPIFLPSKRSFFKIKC